MEHVRQFRELLRRCLNGSQEAAAELWQTFSPHARQAVRENLSPAVRCKCDSDDILQAMWLELFTRVLAHCQPGSPEELIGLLRRMAQWHTLDLYRRYCRSGRRAISRELSLETPAVQRLVEGMGSRELPPDKVIQIHEDLARLLDHAEAERDCQIVTMVCAGRTNAEIASSLGVSTRTVQRALIRLAREYLADQGYDCPADTHADNADEQ